MIDPDEHHLYLRIAAGHLAPLASFNGTLYSLEVNYLSNIVPQKAAMNNGHWGDLEDDVRKLVVKHRTVWVMCGTLYDIDAEELPSADEPHEVPGAFWKVILAKPVGEPLKVAAFIINQEAKRTDKYADALTTIKAIQDRKGEAV